MSKFGSTAPLKTPSSPVKRVKSKDSTKKRAKTTKEVMKKAGKAYDNQTTDSNNK